MSETGGWNRRDFIGAAALLAGVVGLPVGAILMSDFHADDAPTDRQRELLRIVSDIVIPPTDTPGAGEVGTGDFVLLALAHGLDGTRDPAATAALATALPQYRRRDGTLRYVNWLEDRLDRAANGDWIRKEPSQRTESLATLDAEAFEKGAPESPWRKIKGIILTGYYTSEAGGAREQQFELVPGRYDPKVLLEPDARAFSSDWTAVDFG